MDNLDGPIRSRFRGLSWDKKHQGWRVRIYFAGKQRHVGRFEDDVTAAKAYDKAAVYLYGANAITNFGLEACEADPTEVSGFIVLAKEQVEQEQQGRGQQRLIADSLKGLTSLSVQYSDGLQHAVPSLCQAAHLSSAQHLHLIPVGESQQRQQMQGGMSYDLQQLQQQQILQQLGMQQNLQVQSQQQVMMASPMALTDVASNASCVTSMTTIASGSNNTLNSSGYVICSSPALQRTATIPSHAYIDISPTMVPSIQQQQQQQQPQQLMFFNSSSQPLQLQLPLQPQATPIAVQMAAAAGASESSLQRQLLQQQLANLTLPMSLPLNAAGLDSTPAAGLGGQWVTASIADQGLNPNSFWFSSSNVSVTGAACASSDFGGDGLGRLPAHPPSAAAANCQQVTFIPLASQQQCQQQQQQQQHVNMLLGAAGGSYGPEYSSSTSSGCSPLVLSSSARVPLAAVAAAAASSPNVLLACQSNRSLHPLTSTSTSIQLEGSPTHSNSSDGSRDSKTFALKAYAMG